MIKRVVIFTLIFFTIGCFVFCFAAAIIQASSSEIKKEQIIKSETALVETEKTILSKELYGVGNDLKFITYILRNYGLDNGGFEAVVDLWKEFSEEKRIYDQIRYIDADGFEQIRINYTEEGAVSISSAELQNKKDRYYFINTMVLENGQIYISPLDLNIENGEIEDPIKPMVRLSTPLYNQRNELLGIVIVNYYAEYMLENFQNVAGTRYGEMYLLNTDGYWISNSEHHQYEWAFMYEDQDTRFQDFFPDEWEKINKEQGGVLDSNEGYFVYSRITLLCDNTRQIVPGESNWIAVSYISTENQKEELVFLTFGQHLWFVIQTQLVVFVSIFIIAILLSVLIAVNKKSKDRIRYFSEHDIMTNALNRRAGMTLLSKAYRYAKKTDSRLSVCFMDVNGLKVVNDNLGHEMGDKLLVTVAECIKSCTRNTDYFVRLGGDEFLLVLPGSGKDVAETIWQRVKKEIDAINASENRGYAVSVSHGIAEFHFEIDESIDTVLNAADDQMYKEKTEIKKTLNVLK